MFAPMVLTPRDGRRRDTGPKPDAGSAPADGGGPPFPMTDIKYLSLHPGIEPGRALVHGRIVERRNNETLGQFAARAEIVAAQIRENWSRSNECSASSKY